MKNSPKTSRPPAYRLKILNKVTDAQNPNAGAAWVNKDGSISLTINLGIVLTDNKDIVLTLFPYEEREK